MPFLLLKWSIMHKIELNMTTNYMLTWYNVYTLVHKKYKNCT